METIATRFIKWLIVLCSTQQILQHPIAQGLSQSETAEVRLETCRAELKTMSTGHFTELNKLLENSLKLKEELETAMEKSKTTRNEWSEKVTNKRADIQNLKRSNALKDTTIARKFDCRASSFTVKQCKSFCTFPYSYDSCTNNQAQLKFVQRLEATEGKCLHYTYMSSGQKCSQIHVVV